ncbi:MAG: hypothetical protein JNL51_18200 [Chitinophagaceae bacterium]|nr:hypothetical protein [Chitinophagaceae bacterium]
MVRKRRKRFLGESNTAFAGDGFWLLNKVGQNIIFVCSLALIMWLPGRSTAQSAILEKFSLDGSRNILEEDDFGIINGHITTRINYTDVATISGLYAPPYASSDFLMEIRFFGEKVPTQQYKWYPMEVKRSGELHGVRFTTSTVLAAGMRAGLMEITLENKTKENKTIPIQFNVKGGLDYVPHWDFARPEATKPAPAIEVGNSLVKINSAGVVAVRTDIPGLRWFDLAYHWDTRIDLAAGATRTYYVAVAIGYRKLPPESDLKQPTELVKAMIADPKKIINDARQDYTEQLEDLYTKLPKFTAGNKRLEAYYDKSLLHFLITKWKVPEFVLQPYYGTGAVIGGCVANYLWDFGIPNELFPLYDPKSSKEHIKQFLKIDITQHFLFDPMTGNANGPWYPVNQDKIIELIYYYVLHTGDAAFLSEKVDGMTVLDHAVKNAMFGDDGPDKPVTLVDYGIEGEHHLELRRGYPYHGIMPDLNGRRYLSYIRVYELTQLAGKPLSYLPGRAEGLKKLLKDRLWSAKDKWFYFDIDGKKDLRWTNIMYMLINSPVLDKEQKEGMISHLNEEEFLSDYGIHSISKIDQAYDQVDIDHGGGGSYVAFPSMISQQLYNEGYQKAADDLLQRHLWLAERLPYWGDSHPANFIGYRFDTPLQSTFDATAGAQSVIFGIFGVKVKANGEITINPHTPSFSPDISLKGLKIRGNVIDITANLNDFTVTANNKTYRSKIGKPVVIAAVD